MFGLGATDMAAVLVTGETWMQGQALEVPGTIRVAWEGALGHGLSAKDMTLAMCARLGLDGGGYQVVQYAGAAVEVLPMASV